MNEETTLDRQQAAPGCCTPTAMDKLPEATAGRLVRAFKALGHPVRLQIVHLLARRQGHVCVCDVEAQFDLTQPTISHHLRVLREAGLVASEQRGLYAYYHVQPDILTFLRGRLSELAP